MASHISGDFGRKMNFLNDDIGWTLLCEVVFGSEDGGPLQLEGIGRKIAKSCKGLPLAIVVIGGLLAKSEKSQEYWKYIAENLNSLEEKEHCLNVLNMSYNYLPVHLKPCFLYIGIFAEDDVINVERLIELWVVEGFLKPINDKRLEEVVVEYLKDLVDRNLILVEKRDCNGEVESCKIHDLLRDLCLRESQKDKFLHNLNNSLQVINTQRRVAIDRSTLRKTQYNVLQILDAFQSASLACTFICDTVKVLPSPSFRLLRVYGRSSNVIHRTGDEYSLSSISQLVNWRSFTVAKTVVKSPLSSSIYLFWNLQNLVLHETGIKSFDIWKMPLLHSVRIYKDTSLMNPGQDNFVLGDLHTLCVVRNFRCSEKVVKRIPNIKYLGIVYDGKRFIGSRYCLNNLACSHKLEQLGCFFEGEIQSGSELVHNLTFPHSLKGLGLSGCRFLSEDISTKIGSLPHLQVLLLKGVFFTGLEWETIDRQFCSLKMLKIEDCSDLECWKIDNAHFPCLERLVLARLAVLKEIPSTIGDIPTLRLIKLTDCSYPVVISAKKIAEEQEELENPDLHVLVRTEDHYEEMKTLASPNFEVVS